MVRTGIGTGKNQDRQISHLKNVGIRFGPRTCDVDTPTFRFNEMCRVLLLSHELRENVDTLQEELNFLHC